MEVQDNPHRHVTGSVTIYPPPSPPTLLDRVMDIVEPIVYRFFDISLVLLGMAIFYDITKG